METADKQSIGEYMTRLSRLPIARTSLQGFLHGDTLTARHGDGSEFAEFAEYQPGDDVRSIDWGKSSANLPGEYTKKVTHPDIVPKCFLVSDMLGIRHAAISVEEDSLAVGSILVGAQIASMARSDGMPFGTLFSNGHDIIGSLPKTSPAHITRQLESGLVIARDSAALFAEKTEKPKKRLFGKGTQGTETTPMQSDMLPSLLQRIGKIASGSSVIAVVSDFRSSQANSDGTFSWTEPMLRLAAHHDVLAIDLTSPSYHAAPNHISVIDPATGKLVSSENILNFSEIYERNMAELQKAIKDQNRGHAYRYVPLRTDVMNGDWSRAFYESIKKASK